MENDVDPMSMTLEEIYGLPEEDFEIHSRCTIEIHGIDYVAYNGVRHRSNGTKFFTIKATTYVDRYGMCYCYMCLESESESPELFWNMYSQLGDPDMTRRAHP